MTAPWCATSSPSAELGSRRRALKAARASWLLLTSRRDPLHQPRLPRRGSPVASGRGVVWSYPARPYDATAGSLEGVRHRSAIFAGVRRRARARPSVRTEDSRHAALCSGSVRPRRAADGHCEGGDGGAIRGHVLGDGRKRVSAAAKRDGGRGGADASPGGCSSFSTPLSAGESWSLSAPGRNRHRRSSLALRWCPYHRRGVTSRRHDGEVTLARAGVWCARWWASSGGRGR
jgi:hypothetical protein